MLLVLLAIPLTTGVLLYASLWWSERPLKAVERALAQRDFPRAMELVDNYLKSDRNSSRALDLKAQALVGLRKFGDALAIYDRVGTDTVPGLRAWAEAMLHEKRWSDALLLLHEVDQRKPHDPDVVHQLSACAMQTGDFEEAVRKAEELTLIPDHFERGTLLLGVLHINHGNYRSAAEAFEQLLEKNPQATGLQISPEEFFQGLGQSYLGDGKPEQAIERLEQAIAIQETADRFAFLGDAWELKGDLAKAVAAWVKSIALDSDQVRAREGLARAALEERQPAQVIEWLTPLSTPDKLTSAIAHSLKRANSQLGDTEAAKKWEVEESRLRDSEDRKRALDDLVKQSPRSFWALAVRAHRFASEGNTPQAANLLRTVDEVRRSSAKTHDDPRKFIDKLLNAVQEGTELPSLDLVPIEIH